MNLNTFSVLILFSLSSGLSINQAQANNEVVNELLKTYASQGAPKANAEQGKLMWQKTFKSKNGIKDRSCASCHTKDLSASGKHVKTHKTIKPMSPSVNPQRLSKIKKVEKWFKRNCKWTLNRECSSQEKADFLVYINQKITF